MPERYIEAIQGFFEKADLTVEALNRTLAKDVWDEAQRAGAGKFLSNIYSTVENVLQAILRANDIKILKDESWHKVLLQKSKDFVLFEDELYPSLYLMLQFRHVERTGYGVDMKEDKIRESAPDAIKTYTAFKAHILKVMGVVDIQI